jgi:hypothetical protein
MEGRPHSGVMHQNFAHESMAEMPDISGPDAFEVGPINKLTKAGIIDLSSM